MLDVLVSRSAEQAEQEEDQAFIARHNSPHPPTTFALVS